MNLSDLMEQRRTIHSYTSESIPEEVVREALRLALWAPNHKHTHPWLFYWIGPQARSQLAELAVELKQQEKPLSQPMQDAVRAKILDPAELIVLGCRRSESAFQNREDYASVAAGVQNATLYLWSRSVGSKWSTGGVTRHDKTYEILSVSKADVELVGFLWMGIPERVPPAPPRPELESVLVTVP